MYLKKCFKEEKKHFRIIFSCITTLQCINSLLPIKYLTIILEHPVYIFYEIIDYTSIIIDLTI